MLNYATIQILMQNNNGSNLIIKLTFDFAIKIIRFSRELEENRRFAIAN